MNYEYIRRLTGNIPVEQKKRVVEQLSAKGIELYEKAGQDAYKNIDTAAYSDDSDIYISAADLEYARSCVTELGLQQYLCTLQETQVVKSAAEEAEAEYYRRRKIRLLECAVVLVMGLIYFIYKSLAG